MGDRLYNALTGRFTSLDPEPGGNDTAYTYPNDPINMYDLDGHWGGWRKIGRWGKKHKWDIALTEVSFVPASARQHGPYVAPFGRPEATAPIVPDELQTGRCKNCQVREERILATDGHSRSWVQAAAPRGWAG